MSDDLERYMEERRAEAHEDERQADDLAATISQLQAEIARYREALEEIDAPWFASYDAINGIRGIARAALGGSNDKPGSGI